MRARAGDRSALRRAVRIGLVFLLALTSAPWLAVGASRAAVDPRVWITNGGVNDIVADGNTLYVGGGFTRVGPATGGGVPVSATTFVATPGFPRVVGTVTTVAADGAGGWYVGGAFTAVGGLPRLNLAHITSALTVDGWKPTADALVLSLVVTPTDVIIGGTFTSVDSLPRPRLARIARSTGFVTPWAPAPNDRVTALASDGTTLYVAGWFDSIALGSRAGLASFTLATDALTPWDPAATSLSPPVQVHAVALGNGYVYAGGSFNTIGGQSRQFAAALRSDDAKATSWHPFGFNTAVTRVLPIGDRVILGGSFTAPGFGIAAVDTATGAAFSWLPHLSPPSGSVVQVRELEAIGSRIAVGGAFTVENVGGLQLGNFAVFDTASAVLLPSPRPPADVWAIVRQGSQLYVGGQFASLSPGTCRNLVAINAVTGQATGWAPDAGHTDSFGGFGRVSACAVDADRVYAAVTFADPSLGGSTRSQVRAFSRSGGGLLWQVDCDQVVNALAARAGVAYAGGAFSFLGGAKTNLAALDAATGTLQAWAPAPDAAVLALHAAPAALIAAGEFTHVGGQSRGRVAQVDYASGLPTGWNPGADQRVWALARSGSTLYVGGDFGVAGGQPRSYAAALDLGSNAALPWNPGPSANVVALATDGASVFLGGSLVLPASHFMAVNASSGAPLAWGASANAGVNALAIANSHVFLGGQFSAVDTEPAVGLAGVFDPALLAVDPPRLAPSTRLVVGPSPLRGEGHVRFTLAHDATVCVRVFDISGRVVRTLVAGENRTAGAQQVALRGDGLAPGVYHIRLEAGAERAATHFVVLP